VRTHNRGRSRTRRGLSALAVAATSLTIYAAPAEAGSGGIGSSSGGSGAPTSVAGSKAKLVDGKAIPPSNAPLRVVDVIEAANAIRKKPYVYGGGHASWRSRGYDCSGAVSYALHGGGLLARPLDSSGLAGWGRSGKGSWISVYGAPSHAYMVVAGLRFDTAMTPGDGPSWSTRLRSTPEHYAVRHKVPF
jgi:cell wall-associated NlpC family hydrolase